MDLTPVLISVKIAIPAMALSGIFGTALGYVFHRYSFRGKTLLEQLFMLPLVIPPIVIGFYLVMVLGRRGLPSLLGLPNLVFTIPGGIIAVTIVCLPLMIRSAKATFEMMPREYVEISYTLGKSRIHTFLHVTLPICGPGILAGLMLSLARAMGEFGASLMILGNIPGYTTSMPIAIWTHFTAGREADAFNLVIILTLISVAMMLVAEAVSRWSLERFER